MEKEVKQYNAFTGVFIPTTLSILGVIMYLRLGYIVGTAGVLGAILIIILAASITIATGLSLSSLASNIRIGAGGAYSIISKTFGLEVGGTIGIPLYLAQIFSVALYIFGFTEGWLFIFPEHSRIIILLCTFFSLLICTLISTDLAIKTQLITFGIVVASLVSVFLGGSWWTSPGFVPIWGNFPETSFWAVFALFFPAVTGLMAGTGLSGQLSDPKRQIPRGVISALTLTTVLYLALVLWFGHTTRAEVLIADTSVIVQLSAYAPLVLAGILAATFSSALTTLVAAPRLLNALGANGVLPFSNTFSKTANGEPRNAILLTLLFIAAIIFTSSLDAIAPLLTMFFLIAYAMTNISVFTEQSLGLVSFRPTLRIPLFVSFYGAIGSIIIMFFINIIAGLIALAFIFIVYTTLVQRKLKPKEGDVRSGMFRAFSEWATRKVIKLPESTKHIWKPNVVLPVVTTHTLLGNFPLIKSIVHPNGIMTVLGLRLIKQTKVPEEIKVSKKTLEKQLIDLPQVVEKFEDEGIFTSSSVVSVRDYTNGICVALETMESQAFKPNILFLPFKPKQISMRDLSSIFDTAKRENVGVILFDRDEAISLGSERDIHVWIPHKVLNKEFYSDRSFDLSLLLAYRLYVNWNAKITLWMCTDKENASRGRDYLKKIIYEGRLPSSTIMHVTTETLRTALKKAPQGDIHVIPVNGAQDIKKINRISSRERKSFLFVLDSGKEDVLA